MKNFVLLTFFKSRYNKINLVKFIFSIGMRFEFFQGYLVFLDLVVTGFLETKRDNVILKFLGNLRRGDLKFFLNIIHFI